MEYSPDVLAVFTTRTSDADAKKWADFVHNLRTLPDTCPECGSEDIQFGSSDPCEGDYYWCNKCGCGPIKFPHNHVMSKVVA